MTKKEVPKHIKEFYDRHEKVRKLLDSTQAAHSAAYNKGLEVIKDDKGEVDYEKLEDTAVQDKFLDKMMDHYLNFAVKKLGLKEMPKDEWEQDVILGRYVGVTRGQLRQTLRKHKGKYTLKEHEGTRDKLIKKQGEELSPLRYSHLEKKR